MSMIGEDKKEQEMFSIEGKKRKFLAPVRNFTSSPGRGANLVQALRSPPERAAGGERLGLAAGPLMGRRSA
jgi:hypothetical protein